ncbi:MAG: MFS transporter [Anaerolineae bacterium]|jgi:PPP family 3-phenylpropionic acid transporter|nr:MFS transporter [Anaerolineae bacterium]
MMKNQKPLTKSAAYTRAATYYVSLWGALTIAGNFFAVDFHRRGVTEFQWSIITAMQSLVVFLISPLVTRLADRSQRRVQVLKTILVLNAFTVLLLMLPSEFPGFLLAMFLLYLVGTGISPVGDSIIVRMSRNHGLQYGRLRLWGSIGYVLFGVLGGLLWDAIGFGSMYWISSVASLGVALIAGRLEEPLPDETVGTSVPLGLDASSGNKTIFQMLSADPVLFLFLIAVLLRAAGDLMFLNFSGIYMDQLTGRAFFTGLVNGGSAILEIPVMLFAQQWIRKFGMVRIIIAGFIIQMIGLGIFALNLNPWIMFIGSIVRSIGFAFFVIAAVQFIDQRAGVENASTYQGLFNSVSWGLAPLVIAPLAGWVYQSMGGQAVFIGAALVSFLAVLVMVPVWMHTRKEIAPASFET